MLMWLQPSGATLCGVECQGALEAGLRRFWVVLVSSDVIS